MAATDASVFVCAVCYEGGTATALLYARTLSCGHMFHGACIERWFLVCDARQRDGSCPVCRRVIRAATQLDARGRAPAHADAYVPFSRDTLVVRSPPSLRADEPTVGPAASSARAVLRDVASVLTFAPSSS